MNLEQAKTVANIFGIVAIPVVTLVVGNSYTKAIKEREIQSKFVELAVGILSEEPSEENKNIRNWSIDVINQYSGVEISKETRTDLIDKIQLTPLSGRSISDITPPQLETGELKIKDHFIVGDNTSYLLSSNTSGNLDMNNIKALIINYTASGDISQSAKFLTDSSVKASTHILIDRDGKIIQLLPFDFIGWHAGASQFKGLTNFNDKSIAIELINWGVLTESDGKYFSYSGVEVPASEVEFAQHKNETSKRYWHKYTDIQLKKAKEVSRLIVNEYNIGWILGHDDISPGRKQDPGPLFPLKEFQKDLTGSIIE